MTSIVVVIVSFNTCELLRGCLESLRSCALPLRVVVVENGSRDDSPRWVGAGFPAIELITLGQNVGFAAGTNVGIRGMGDGDGGLGERDHPPSPDYILLLNPDTIVQPGAIETL